MKKSLIILTLLFCYAQTNYAQIARHFWLNDSSYNHTLYPTSDGGYILAAARQELGANKRNTIAVLKLDSTYTITNSQIIGIPLFGSDEEFSVVNFDVHDIVENVPKECYVICGSINYPGGSDGNNGDESDTSNDGDEENPENPNMPTNPNNKGMILIIDLSLQVQSFREYSAVNTFFSAYASDNYYYYACGNTHSQEGIVVRDEMFTLNPTAYETTDTWVYHKIILNNGGNDVVASGTDGNEIGFTAFDITNGNFAPVNTSGIDESWKLSQACNSKVAVANNPNNPQGLILSATNGSSIYTFLFSNYQITLLSPMFGYELKSDYPLQLFLEDATTSPTHFACVGYHIWSNQTRMAFYYTIDLSFQINNQYFIVFPPSLSLLPPPFLHYHALYKVHYNNNDFHCGGFYSHSNGNKTTFLISQTQALTTNTCGTEDAAFVAEQNNSQPQVQSLSVTGKNISVTTNSWLEIQHSFCDTDCDDTPLNSSSNSNCGNQ